MRDDLDWYAQGYAAHGRGDGLDANPWTVGADFEEWERGWHDAGGQREPEGPTAFVQLATKGNTLSLVDEDNRFIEGQRKLTVIQEDGGLSVTVTFAGVPIVKLQAE